MYTPTSFFLLSSWWCLLLLLSSWWCLLLLLSSWWCLLLPLLRRWWSLLLRCEECEWWVVEETVLSDWRPLASYLCKLNEDHTCLTLQLHITFTYMHVTASVFAWVYKVCAGYMIHTVNNDIIQVMNVVRWMLSFSLHRFQIKCIRGSRSTSGGAVRTSLCMMGQWGACPLNLTCLFLLMLVKTKCTLTTLLSYIQVSPFHCIVHEINLTHWHYEFISVKHTEICPPFKIRAEQ